MYLILFLIIILYYLNFFLFFIIQNKMIDFFPFYYNPIQLNYNNKSKYSNIFDVLISILTIITFIIILVYFIFESFSKEPFLYYQNNKIENMANYTFSRLPFFFGLVHIKSRLFIKNFHEIMIPFLSYNNKGTHEKIELRYCNESELLELDEYLTGKKSENISEHNFFNDYTDNNYNNNSIQNYTNLFICPDLKGKEYTLKGTQNVVRNDGFIFSFHFIKRRDLEIPIDYEQFELLVVWPDYYFDSLDYDNPIKKKGKSELLLFNNERMEHYSMNYDQNIFISNKGFFFPNKNETTYLSYNSINHKSMTQRLMDEQKEYISLVTLDIYLTNLIHIDNVRYIKFTDILTKIVSLFSLIKHIFAKLSIKFRNKSIFIDLINHFQNNEIIQKKIYKKNEINDLNIENIDYHKKKFKLSLCQYLLPTYFYKNNPKIKLFNLYKEFFLKRISVETLIYVSLQNDNFYYTNHDKSKNSINDSILSNEFDEKKHYLIDSGWE